MRDRVTRSEIGHMFRGRYTGGRSERAPLRGKKQRRTQKQMRRKFEISDLRFGEMATARNAKADPSPLKRVRDDNVRKTEKKNWAQRAGAPTGGSSCRA
jgi:hypothetical protein